jgi:uncharacterized membrane protein YoaK (UPF0700 family)
MVDLTGFFTLGNLFTAHITGNLVLAAAAAVHSGPADLAQLLAIPVFMLALAAVWLVALVLDRPGPGLLQPLLLLQFLLLAAVLIFSVLTKPSVAPHGLTAGIAAMIAVSAMASQYALLRLAIPGAISTAVMTGNLTNTVLSLIDTFATRRPLLPVNAGRLKRSLRAASALRISCRLRGGGRRRVCPGGLGLVVSRRVGRRCDRSAREVQAVAAYRQLGTFMIRGYAEPAVKACYRPR